MWDSNLLTGTKDADGKDIYVPVFGYKASIYNSNGGQQYYSNEYPQKGKNSSDATGAEADPVTDIEITEHGTVESAGQGAVLNSFIGPVLAFADQSNSYSLSFN